MSVINVSEEAIGAEKLLYEQLARLQQDLEASAAGLLAVHQDNGAGLGAHSARLGQLMERLQQDTQVRTPVGQLRRALGMSILNRKNHRDRAFPGKNRDIPEADSESAYLAGVLGRIYEGGYRQLRAQNTDGHWQGDLFLPDRNAVPTKYNPDNQSFGQILDELKSRYGIDYRGTAYREGYADFSPIALARVDLADIVSCHVRDGLAPDPFVDGEKPDYGQIFSQRTRNFHYADELAAKAQVPIVGLAAGYSADDLAQWRQDNRFTWDESYLNGYLLVPALIHNNIAHTGLVGISAHVSQAEQAITDRLKKYT